ncbi:sugar phosphate permease [Paraburkholderia caballeronis]|uniref:Sugar phosphate permease n=2 Tax=Paraburkholderia caballeronis TaxID=416943 RepID=A0A1H7FPR1_9BURK|nr:sugar phosphate permease [Paraburkholderia caballeronis]PXX00646.1 sugar phosphate permease [Paraburkholderia caballeronis]RAJ98709.1 sugar phosphate permease [Paraburkholderia caballeronis]TDV16474.1 sugar phosphate permease [Paraburkholderia caballeronis]TDV18870.1 sugar phosphate permease [Paraburkholderia caballeronis]
MFRRATTRVLLLLCAMYLITYVDRVNVSTAAGAFGAELKLSHTQVGFVFSAFAYPYLIFQIIGGWVGDRFGPRRTLTICAVIWAGATILTGLAGGFLSLVVARLLLGLGEGATFPTATRAMSNWMPAHQRGFAQGTTHAASRIGNAVAPPLIVWLMLSFGWRGAFFVTGIASCLWAVVWVWYFRDDPRQHPRITGGECDALETYSGAKERVKVPWRRLTARMSPVTAVYFCYGWVLWLFLGWIPQYFLHNYHMELSKSALFASGVFFAGVIGDWLGGLVTDRILRRSGNLRLARNVMVGVCMLCTLLSLAPILLAQNVTVTLAALCLSAGFFFNEMTIGPMWAVPMDIAPRHAGTASGIMNTGSAGAAIVSPVVGGWLIDTTGNWNLPFTVSMAIMAAGVLLSFAMRPDRKLDAETDSVGGAPARTYV